VCTIRMRGNTVMEMSPQNESPNVYPYYRREFMKGDVAPLKTVQRYVSPVIPGC
jgi:hypothetical protein